MHGPIAAAMRERLSPNHDRRAEPARIDMLVLHYTGMQSATAAIARLCDPAARVSAHYLVEEDGCVWRLVAERRRAFHAGLSCWRGESDLNQVSIGIEIVNPGHEWGYRGFPDTQMQAVETLCRDILLRHPIPPQRVVGHSDIAPERKTDPGELFDWPRLARAGIGLWPKPGPGPRTGAMGSATVLAELRSIGYCATEENAMAVIAAFQRRFRPTRCDGELDDETRRRIADVAAAFAAQPDSTGGVKI